MTASPQPGKGQRRGRVITFYSYKGGTGRTMGLANVAWILASQGRQVLAIDWDLESPGLHRFFHPMLADPDLRCSDGVIDMVRDYADAVIAHQGDPEAVPAEARPDVLRYAASIEWEFPHDGGLDLLPAGRQEPGYATAVSTFDWPSFYERLAGATFLADLRQNLCDNYDYVLIDSRTGLSDSAGICTVLLPDTLVDCFTLNMQSVEGAVAVAASAQRQHLGEPLRVLPVPMRVEEGEQRKLESGRDNARSRFARFLRDLDHEQTLRYWADVEIPYKIFYAYEEILAVFGDRARQPSTLLAAYERLAAVVSDERLDPLPALDEPTRKEWLGRFERSRTRTIGTLVISYAPEDQRWADWISGVLRQRGVATVLWDASGETLFPANDRDSVLAVLSISYGRHELPGEVAKRLESPQPGWGTVIPVCVDASPLLEGFEHLEVFEISGSSVERASSALLAALNLTDAPGDAEATPAVPRYPASLPKFLRLNRPKPTFTGRRGLISTIRSQWTQSPPGTPIVLAGLGGIGKTQVASAYAQRYAYDYDIVWSVSAGQASTLRSDLVDLADALGIPETDTPVERIRLLRESLSESRAHQRYLLIFDNVRRPEDIQEVLPTGPGHVLLTSRGLAWTGPGTLIEVRPFHRGESVRLLRTWLPSIVDQDADKVADLLGDLPLAVDQAGSWLASTGIPVDRYLALVANQLSRLLAENPTAGHEREAGKLTWLLSLDQMREEAPAAAHLMELLAFFGPDPIPRSLLYSRTLVSLMSEYDSALRDDVDFGRLISQVSRYALASFDSAHDSMQMHRLVQAVIRESLPEEVAERCQRQVHHILVAEAPNGSQDPTTWPAFSRLLPHILPSRALLSAEDDVRQLVLDAIRLLFRRGDFPGSAEMAQSAIGHWTKRWPDNDLKLLAVQVFLANSLRAMGEYVRARHLDERAYAGLMEVVGPEHQYTVMCMAGLAADLWTAAEYTRARELNEQALTVSCRLFGAEDRRTFRAMNNLGVLLEQIGDYRTARDLHERAFARRRRALGERFPETLLSATLYGRVLRSTGDLRGSRRALDSAVISHRAVHGEDHPATLRTKVELSATLRRLGDLERAHQLASSAFEVYHSTRRRHQSDHLACSNALALVLSARGDQPGAMELGMASADGHTDIFGEEHPFTLAVRCNVAVFLLRSGELDSARELAGDLVGRMRDVLGPSHPHTLQCAVVASNCLAACGDWERSVELDRLTHQVMADVLGQRHPDWLVAGCALASSREAVGDTDGLVEFRAVLENLAIRLLGRGHPLIDTIRRGARADCEIDLTQLS